VGRDHYKARWEEVSPKIREGSGVGTACYPEFETLLSGRILLVVSTSRPLLEKKGKGWSRKDRLAPQLCLSSKKKNKDQKKGGLPSPQNGAHGLGPKVESN